MDKSDQPAGKKYYARKSTSHRRLYIERNVAIKNTSSRYAVDKINVKLLKPMAKKTTTKRPLKLMSPIVENLENTQDLSFCAEGTSASSDTSHKILTCDKIESGSSSIKEEGKCSRPKVKRNEELGVLTEDLYPIIDLTTEESN